MISVPAVFVGGDLVRGPSLVAHAVRDGRQAVAGIHQYLQECRESSLAQENLGIHALSPTLPHSQRISERLPICLPQRLQLTGLRLKHEESGFAAAGGNINDGRTRQTDHCAAYLPAKEKWVCVNEHRLQFPVLFG